MSDCLFCKIVDGRIPGAIVYQDDQLVAFKDINPQAPMHLLVVPRRHIASLNALTPEDDGWSARWCGRGAALASEHGYADAATARCSTPTRTRARRSSTSTCTSSAAAR